MGRPQNAIELLVTLVALERVYEPVKKPVKCIHSLTIIIKNRDKFASQVQIKLNTKRLSMLLQDSMKITKKGRSELYKIRATTLCPGEESVSKFHVALASHSHDRSGGVKRRILHPHSNH